MGDSLLKGILIHQLRKNWNSNIDDYSFIKKLNDNYYKVILDGSGFEHKDIEFSIEDLSKSSGLKLNVNNTLFMDSDISNATYIPSNNKIFIHVHRIKLKKLHKEIKTS
ncbi:hypothetical protein [Aquimarina sp. 2201CG5-10]|uniref:hypothetical protein n=1 Tax=Aquimarina callyspongiae TaxID=3098150 RepID=UPI002AB417D5|nr:hypothetical protein [Aquimarina sp. 2201CG5-10]MDY8136912.1 hypothetical protein [Aquimarina sp. 2201CG5-10]